MKKTYVLAEIGIAVLVLLILTAVFVPKFLGNQSREQLKRLNPRLTQTPYKTYRNGIDKN